MSTREFGRPQRVAEQIRRELAEILSREASDPRFSQLTISAVEVSRDLSNAKIFIVPPADIDVIGLLKALRRATGYVRKNLAERLNIRIMPALRFVHDKSMEDALRVSELIDDAIAKETPLKPEEDG